MFAKLTFDEREISGKKRTHTVMQQFKSENSLRAPNTESEEKFMERRKIVCSLYTKGDFTGDFEEVNV